jgi:hypothetical protein
MSAALDLAKARATAEEAQKYALLLERADLDSDTRRAHELRLRSLCASGAAAFRFVGEGLG